MARKTTNKARKQRPRQPGRPKSYPMITDGRHQVFGFPTKLRTKLRYCDSYNIVSSAGAVAKQTFIVNSIYDPDYTGSGHQPLYRDTFTTIYDQYAVVGCTVRITFVGNGTTATVVGAVFDDDTTTSTTPYVLMEQSRGKHMLLAQATGALNRDSLVLTWDCEESLGIDPYTSETYKTASGSNPAEQATLLVWAAPANGTDTVTTTLLVDIEFDVLFTELQTMLGS